MNKDMKNDIEKLRKVFKVGKEIKRSSDSIETTDSKQAIGQAVAKAKTKTYKSKKIETTTPEKIPETLQTRYDSGELMVITKAKELCFYIITITEKSPKKFRFSFVSKLHNSCINILENLFKANITSKKTHPEERRQYQLEAYTQMKMVGYFAFLALENECILKKTI